MIVELNSLFVFILPILYWNFTIYFYIKSFRSSILYVSNPTTWEIFTPNIMYVFIVASNRKYVCSSSLHLWDVSL